MEKTESPVVQAGQVKAKDWPFGTVPKATFRRDYKDDARFKVPHKEAQEALL